MAKRNADKELTDRNWDQEEEGEEAGTFCVASQDVLKTRTMKKAKRRTPAETENSATFKGFKGFSLTTSTPAAFSGFGKGGAFTGLTNGSAPSVGGGATTMSTQATGLTFGSSASDLNGAASRSSASCSSSEYNKQLTALNCSVRDWISKHVDDNPLCDLNPIFRDYERHLASIERQYGAPADAASEDKMADLPPAPPSSSSSSSSSSTAAPLFPFSRGAPEVKPPPGVTFNFGQKVEAPALASPPPPSGFSFTSSSHTSLFGGAAAQSSKSEEAPPPTEENEDEEAEEPPRPEVKEVQEKDAFYSRKCKLFYQKEQEFREKGVGTLHLKTTDQGRTQLIIRADTNLGNILLNILVQASIPVTRVGRNNVMLLCVPNPPVDDKSPASPVPLLVRVKTAQDADELHRILEEKKS